MLACLQRCDAAGRHARAPGPVDCAPESSGCVRGGRRGSCQRVSASRDLSLGGCCELGRCLHLPVDAGCSLPRRGQIFGRGPFCNEPC